MFGTLARERPSARLAPPTQDQRLRPLGALDTHCIRTLAEKGHHHDQNLEVRFRRLPDRPSPGRCPAARAENPGIRHTVFMAGSVIEASAEGTYLCIGTTDGAEPGQVLDVVRMTRNRSGNPKQGVRFHRERVGKVRVDAIVDERFAQATVVNGR